MLLCFEAFNSSIIIPVVVACIPVIGGIIAWYNNEEGKRKQEIMKQKEERYLKMVSAFKAFGVYKNSDEKTLLLQEFLDQLNLCWIYCPDEVIIKANLLVATMRRENKEKYKPVDREKAMGDFLLAIRKDIMNNERPKNTTLNSEDYKSVIPN